MKNELIIFENQDVKLEVNMKDDTVWLNLNQMSELFKRDKSDISKHIKNAFREECVDSTVAKFATVQKEGNRHIERNIEYYDLDVILSVGYRVKSKNGITFRKWANKVLKDHLLKGYSVNEERLKQLQSTVRLIELANSNNHSSDESKDFLKVIGNYTKALNLLDNYDHKIINKINGTKSNDKISYNDAIALVKTLKFNENSNIFGLERNKSLESIINNIYETFDNKDIYETIEEKASNFLYYLVKDHPFIDGNKRIAATLFIYFLNYYNILYKDNTPIIDNNTLASITLLIAESNPNDKDLLIHLIINFLN